MNQKYLELLTEIDSEKVNKKNDRILVIDGLNSYLRIWNSVPFTTENGDHAGGIVGFLRSIGANIRDYNPSCCVIVFDGKGGSHRRRKIYPDYKQHRSGKYNIRRIEFTTVEDEQESMKRQLGRIIEYLDTFPVYVICIDNVEADDVISYAVNDFFTDLDTKIRIVSTDRDFLQLVSNRIEVYSPVKRKLYDRLAIKSEFGFASSNYLLYRILTGDDSDNIDGIRGIGLKTLLKSCPELIDNELDVHSFVESIKLMENPSRIHRLILSEQEKILRNYQLMQLQNIDISGVTKLKVGDILKRSVNKSNISKFKQMLIEDQIAPAFKYPDDWIRNTFARLNQFTG